MTQQNIENIIQENVQLHTKVSVLEEQLENVQRQLAWLKKQIFGRKTEQASVIMADGIQLSLLNEEISETEDKSENHVAVPAHTRKKRRTHDEWMNALEIKKEFHKVENMVCEKCGAPMKVIGEDQAYDELVYIPASFFIRRHIVQTAKCTECGKHEERDAENETGIEKCNIVRAEVPAPLFPGSFCSKELLAHMIYEKYGKAVPLHRQQKDFESKNVPLLKATMSNWIMTAAQRWCLPVVKRMTEILLSEKIIHADETHIQVLQEETTTSQMWVYCNGKMNARSIVVFEYKNNRRGENPAEFLKEFFGYLICDGYAGYNAVTWVKRCGCLTHVRRKFVKLIPEDKELHKTSAAVKTVNYCDRIYHEEHLLENCSAEERYEKRLEKVKPILDEMFAYLESITVSSSCDLGKAVNYALNEKKYLYTFLESGEIPIDNNRAENAIRPFTVGRKNWLFSNTASGAETSAILYSLISTAQANGMDAEKYLTELFSQPAGTIIFPWKETKNNDIESE